MLNYNVNDKDIHWVSAVLGRMRMISTISLNDVGSDFFLLTFGKMNKNKTINDSMDDLRVTSCVLSTLGKHSV